MPDELQEQILKFVVTLRQQHRQISSSNSEVLASTTEVNNSAPSLVNFSHPAVDIQSCSFDVDATPIWEMVLKSLLKCQMKNGKNSQLTLLEDLIIINSKSQDRIDANCFCRYWVALLNPHDREIG